MHSAGAWSRHGGSRSCNGRRLAIALASSSSRLYPKQNQEKILAPQSCGLKKIEKNVCHADSALAVFFIWFGGIWNGEGDPFFFFPFFHYPWSFIRGKGDALLPQVLPKRASLFLVRRWGKYIHFKTRKIRWETQFISKKLKKVKSAFPTHCPCQLKNILYVLVCGKFAYRKCMWLREHLLLF